MREPTVHIIKRPKLRLAKPLLATASPAVKAAPKHTEAFYLTPEWRAKVGEVVRLRGRQCEKCGKKRSADGAPIRVYLDHVIELRDGGSLLDDNNLELLCASCHTAKTIRARKQRLGLG